MNHGPLMMLLDGDPALRFQALAIVLVVVVSIVLHELAHGWMAIRLGDHTPVEMGRMTGNPLVHMGPFSLLALALVGIAWGQMPIDPSRLRGKYGGLKVALAGPMSNLVLAVVGTLAYVLLNHGGWLLVNENVHQNATWLAQILGLYNFLLMLFNLVPVPPLDGSHILADLSPGYARAVENPAMHGVWMLSFVFIFIVGFFFIGQAAGYAFGGLSWLFLAGLDLVV